MGEDKHGKLPTRDEIDDRYKWKLEHIYGSIEEWEQDYGKVEKEAGLIAGYKGILGDSAENLLRCLKTRDSMLSVADKVLVYARMKRDEDNSNSQFQALTDKAMSLATRVYAAISFIEPEIISIGKERINGFIDECPELGLYRHHLDETLRMEKHVLSQGEERILALASEMAAAPGDIFTMYNNADIKFPNIRDEEGREVELTKGRYIKFLESRDRRVREDAFKALYGTYESMRNTLASTLGNSIKKDRFYSSVRNYSSSLEHSLDRDNIPVDVYINLIDTVGNNLRLLHRYLELRKKVLKLDKLHMYDLYVPLVEAPETDIPYEKSVETVREGLKPLGEEYGRNLERAFNSGWIDVYENRGKTSGAYSWGAYLTHPYVLLNYQGTINDVFTLAHELGHAMHSFYTNSTQPYIYSEYKIFVAEVASTVNEVLLLKHVLAGAGDNREKAYLLNHFLEEFRGTVFRQVMFAEFEKIIHEREAAGDAITAQSLSEIYYGLNRKYFGEKVEIDTEIEMEWARIPHFYSSFYVYKYATGFSAAVSLVKQILDEGSAAVARYLDFLRSGDSDYPVELLKKAGVDMTSPGPVLDGMKVFEETIDEMERTILL